MGNLCLESCLLFKTFFLDYEESLLSCTAISDLLLFFIGCRQKYGGSTFLLIIQVSWACHMVFTHVHILHLMIIDNIFCHLLQTGFIVTCHIVSVRHSKACLTFNQSCTSTQDTVIPEAEVTR